ncbi:MAG: hypothetical protein AAB017_04715, partial [Nitrospirota bacterium]
KLLSRQASKDGTEKFLFELEDRESIESVLIQTRTVLHSAYHHRSAAQWDAVSALQEKSGSRET